jgi:hypothetical protein
VVSRTDTDKNFEVVPQTAGAQEIVEGNQPVYFDILEGYGNIETNTEFNISYDLTTIKKYETEFTGGTWRINLDAAYFAPDGDVLVIETGPLRITYINTRTTVDNLGGLLVQLLTTTGVTAVYSNVTKIVTTSISTGSYFRFYSYTPTYTGEYFEVGWYEQVNAFGATGTLNKVFFEETIQGAFNHPNTTDFEMNSGIDDNTYIIINVTMDCDPGGVPSDWRVGLLNVATNTQILISTTTIFQEVQHRFRAP